MGSGLVGLHMKGVLADESFTQRNWLPLRGAVSLGSARPHMSKIHNTENKKA